MANTSRPFGFVPIRHLTGGEIRSKTYKVAASQTIYRGDVVLLNTSGTVAIGTAGAANNFGVAAGNSVLAAANSNIQVYDDPNIVYKVQQGPIASSATVTFAQTSVGARADHYAAAGSATTQRSKQTLAAVTASAATAQFTVMALHPTPDNAVGTNAVVEVSWNEHLFKSASLAGI